MVSEIVKAFDEADRKARENQIPTQLQNPKFRFNLLKIKGKIPFEKEWQKKAYSYDDENLIIHIKEGGNYGVIGGYGRLRLLDIDDPSFVPEIEKAFKTFSVKTGKGGRHFYFLSDYDKNHVLADGKGELRGNMQFVVAPGCTHPNGNKYEVVNDIPILDITEEELVAILKPIFKAEPLVKCDIGKMLKGEAALGERNDGYFRTACLLRFQKISIDVARELITAANERNKKPISQTEIERVIKNAYSYKNEVKKKIAKEEIPKGELENMGLPMINLPQEGKVLISEFINNVSPKLANTDTFYRLGDDTIIELCKGKLKEIKPARMITLIEEVCTPTIQKWNSYGKYWVSKEKSAGEQTSKVLLESPSLRDNIKIIKRTLNVPVPLLIDGKLIFPKKGYNKNLCLYVNPNTPEITNPDLSIGEAKTLIFDLLKEFCFKTNNDSIKTLMALLTPFLRGLYKSWDTRTPLFIYFGNRERCGKDYLAGIRSIIFEGSAIEEPPISTGEKYNNTNDELRKKIMSLLRTGRHFLHFSNNKGHIDNATFEQVITATVWSDRILGSNKIATFENTIEYSLSGNLGTTLTADLKNRSIVINLFLREENANERKFERPNLWGYVKQNRENILSALYSFVRNWHEKDMPISEVPFASFPEWAGICGGVLEAADFENPLAIKDDSYAELDSELENMKLLFEFMYELFPNKDIKKSEIKTQIRVSEEGEGIFSYIDFDERADQMKFSEIFKKYIGRELSGITLVEDTKIKSVFARKIKFIKDYKPQQLDLEKVFSSTPKVKEVQK